MKEDRESFIFHKDWYNAISQLDKDLRLELYDAIMRKALYNEPPLLSPMGNLAMSFIEPQIERDFNKWLDIREKRSNAGKAHKGNQHSVVEQTGQKQTNGTSVPSVPTLEQNGTNGTVTVTVSDNVSVDNNSVILKEKEDTKVSPKKKDSLDLTIVAQEMREVVETWLAYKKEKGQTYKPTGFKTFYNNLIKLSDNNPKIAMCIVEKSMQNNYAGIFALRDWEKETVLRDLPAKQQEMPTNDDMVINGQIYR